MLDINIITVGKVKNSHLAALIAEYLKMAKPFARVEILEVAPTSFAAGEEARAKQEEGERILAKLEKFRAEDIFLLIENGKEYSSTEFAGLLEKNNSRAVFVIAGALGFDNELFKDYRCLSLSKMTLPHEMARLVLIEQLYRAATIINGKKYHY
jgi:23S rRNA (pseudouridine1915-N3)-methyltransferase